MLNGLFRKKRGSVTPEASLGLFLFLLFFVSILYFYQIMILEMRVQSALEETVQVQSAFCVAGEIQKDNVSTLGCELSKAFAKTNLMRILHVDYLERSWVQSGAVGISMGNSQLLEDGETINLQADYNIRIPLIPKISFHVTQRASRRMWIGDHSGSFGREETETSDSGKGKVYVTSQGVAYHLYDDCTYIDVKVNAVKAEELKNLRNESGGIYYPCECCKPVNSGLVYITKYGTRYHTSSGCSAIERDVHEIEEHDIGERHLCKKCQKRAAGEL